jgi:uncharacterized protein (TIGR03067 family)
MRTSALIGSLLAVFALGCGGSSSDVVEPTPTVDTDTDSREATGDTATDTIAQEEPTTPVAKPDDAVVATSGDPSVLGVWKGVEKGQAQPEWIFTITESHMIVTAGTMEVYEGTYTINPNSSPRQITALITKSNLKKYVGKASNGIFELNGDSLTLAANEPGVDSFPSDFTSRGRVRVFELERAP